MFTDIAGYTTLMSEDEGKALAVLEKNRKLQKSLAEKHSGEFLKEMGDGTLICFQSALDAVRCAMAIQGSVKDDPDLNLRIGIHLGDIVFKEGDVFGDGVNVASRIEKLAVAGGVCISGEVYSSIRAQAGLKTVFLGDQHLKHVDHPVAVYALRGRGLITPKPETGHTIPGESGKSIAVLPFVNMSADPEQEYFCEGMAEEIINVLSQIRSLKVIARTSAFVFKGRHEDMRGIGRKLNVRYLLEGSVRKSGTRLRITAQLIDAADASHLWSNSFDREAGDIFAIQDEIAAEVSSNLRLNLLAGEKAALTRHGTADFDAYDLYMKGLYYLNKNTDEQVRKAITCLEKAVKKDNEFAAAYAALAECYIHLYGGIGVIAAEESIPLARKYAQKALVLDPDLAEAHTAMGLIVLYYDWDRIALRQYLSRAIELNPNYAQSFVWYATYFIYFEQNYQEALRMIEKAESLDPLNLLSKTVKISIYHWQGQFEKALDQCRQVIDLEPNYAMGYYFRGMVYEEMGCYPQAISELQKAIELGGRSIHHIGVLGYIYSRAGEREKAMELLNEIKERVEQGSSSASWVARVYAGLEETDEVFEWLDRAYEKRDSSLVYIQCEHEFSGVRADPRFTGLLKKIGLQK